MKYFVCLRRPSQPDANILPQKVYVIYNAFNERNHARNTEYSVAYRAMQEIVEKHAMAEADRGVNRYFFGPPDGYASDDHIFIQSLHQLRIQRANGRIQFAFRNNYLGYGLDSTDRNELLEERKRYTTEYYQGYLAGVADCQADRNSPTGMKHLPFTPVGIEAEQAYARWFHITLEEKNKGERMSGNDYAWLCGYADAYSGEREEAARG